MAEVAIVACCDPIVVVLGSQVDRMKLEIDTLALPVVENQQWQSGMGTSISAGMTTLAAINSDLDAVVIMLCDQPFVSADLINQFAQSYRSTQSPIVASAYANTLGVPALFDQSLFPTLIMMNANLGAKSLIQQHSGKVFQVPFPEGAIDLDTPTQYQQFLNSKTTGSLSSGIKTI